MILPLTFSCKKSKKKACLTSNACILWAKIGKTFHKKMSDVHKFFHNNFQKIYGFYCTVCMIWSNISQKMCTRHFLCVVLCVWCKSMVFDLLCIVDFSNSSLLYVIYTLCLPGTYLINFLSWFSLHINNKVCCVCFYQEKAL